MQGDLIKLLSRRNAGKKDIIRIITKFGRPLIVSTDVSPAPKSVEKISSSIGSMLFVPDKSLSAAEKHDIVKKFKRQCRKSDIEIKVKDRHERDALASAIKAWKSSKSLLRKVNNALKKSSMENVFDDVVSMLIKEESENITNAIRLVEKKRVKHEKTKKIHN